jgi:hypothetical protein
MQMEALVREQTMLLRECSRRCFILEIRRFQRKGDYTMSAPIRLIAIFMGHSAFH